MKAKYAILFLSIICFLIVLGLFKLLNHPIINNDEGIYWTTFLSVSRGHPLYKETFFSQLPGFFLTVYPGFLLFGKTIISARLVILLWSLVGLASLMIFFGWSGVLTTFILLSIPIFLQQIVTFQSDALTVTFSLLSIVSMYRYNDTDKRWLVISAIFFSLAFWTKFDISVAIPVVLVLFLKKDKLKNLPAFLTLIVLLAIAMTLPFGVNEMISNVIGLRRAALAVYPFQPVDVFKLLLHSAVLLLLITVTTLLVLIQKPKLTNLSAIAFIWGVISLTLLTFYRPLFSHHLVFIAVPFSITFSLLISSFNKIKTFVLALFVVLSIFNIMNQIKSVGSSYLSTEERNGVDLIKKYTKENDLVISDEGILNAASGRLPPPELVDISYVRVRSGNLNAEIFSNILSQYKPKLVISWNGRLESIQGFEKTLTDYILTETIDKNRKIYKIEPMHP